jgi:ParB family chromosome partitioning protein
MKSKKKGLGKGLDALLSTTFNQEKKASEITGIDAAQKTPNTSSIIPVLKTDSLVNVPIDICQRGKYQPRKEIKDETLNELAESIKNQGVMQPIILRLAEGNINNTLSYEIIAGERRWRAAQIAGLQSIWHLLKTCSGRI